MVANFPGMVDVMGTPRSLIEIYQDISVVALAIVNSFDTCPACSGEAYQLESFLASKPGLAIVTIMCRATGPGDASLAEEWSTDHGLTEVMVWGDTTDYMYFNFTSQEPLNGSYPSVMVIDIDTMTLTYSQLGGTSSAEAAINSILQDPHPCASY